MCGTSAGGVEEWKNCGGRCGICGNDSYRDECTRCRAACSLSGTAAMRPCSSLDVYRATGRVAFPDKALDTKRERAERNPTKRKPQKPSPAPPAPAFVAFLTGAIKSTWCRYWAGLCKYAVIEGRTHRADFWSFILWQLIGTAATGSVGLTPLFMLITVMPSLAIAVRRLHDIGRSGHWLWLIALWPIAAVVLPCMFLWRGSKGTNAYGKPPL